MEMLHWRPGEHLGGARHAQALQALPWHSLTIVCIGTDRSTGDSFGPWVGTSLQQAGYPRVIGTLEHPCHAVNLSERVAEVRTQHVLAVDASLTSRVDKVGELTLAPGPLRPGAGVHKQLPPVGDYHLVANVNVGGFMEYFVLQNTRLHVVKQLVDHVSALLLHASLPTWQQEVASARA